MKSLQQLQKMAMNTKHPLDSSGDQYRATLNSMRDAIHVIDSDLVILLMNERFETWCVELGIAVSNPVGKTIFDVFSHLSDKVKEEYRQVFESGEVLTTEEVTDVHGHNVATETRKIPIYNGDRVERVVTVIRDITEQKRIRSQKKANEERIRLLFETIPHALYECNRDGIITLTNAAYAKITSYSKEELVGMPIQEHLEPGPQKEEMTSYLEYLVKEQPAPTPYVARNLTKDGRVIDVEINWNYRHNEESQVIGFVCILSDITERKLAERTLQESEERFRVLSDATFEGVVFSEKGILHDVNKAFLNIYGCRYEEAIGKPVIQFVAPEHRDLVMEKIRSGFSGVYEHRGVHRDGHLIDLEVHGHQVTHQGHEMRMTAVRDITARKHAETKLFEYQHQLKSLAHQLTLAEEQEKRRIAEQLHDDLGQCLAFCKMKVQLVLTDTSEPTTVEELETVCEMLTQSMDHIKKLTYDLTSPVLQELGFEKAMDAWLKDDIEYKHAVKTSLIVSNRQTLPTDDTLKAFLYRSTRELVINSVKHAKPDNILVHINRKEETISVCVEDDGNGFDPENIEANANKGFGLFSIRERLDYLGGGLELFSSPGQGCKAILNVPLK
jgi:PAS domain S-box-containing protein